MSAAVEIGIEIPAIGFSLLDYDWNADFETIKSYIRKNSFRVLENGMQRMLFFNVNFPKLQKET
jgi:5'-nucleotidase